MGMEKRLQLIIALLGLAFIAFFFASFGNQAYYHSGVEFTLRKDGFRIQKVVPGSNAALAGLKKDQRIVRINGLDALQLNELSERDLTAFLASSSRFFIIGETMEFESDSGVQYRFNLDPLPWATRVTLFNETVLVNILIGILFIAFGVWLLAVGKKDPAVTWFLFFTIATGIAIAVSFFISYWSPFLLLLRFVTLDLSGVSACIFLIFFVRRFPVPQAFHRGWAITVPLILLTLKYALLALGLIRFYGPVIFFIHSFLLISLVYTIGLLVNRYRELKAGGKRKLRWILAGAALSLFPYVLYVSFLVLTSNILTNSRTILNHLPSFGILLFPIFVVIGVVRYNLFDIDRFLNRFFVLFLLGVIVSIAYSLVFLIFFETRMSLGMYSTLLLTALFSPGLYKLLDGGINRFLFKGRREKRQILLEMETLLLGVYKMDAVYPIVSSAMLSAFDPSFIAFVRNGPAGVHTVDFSYPDPAPPLTGALPEGTISIPLVKRDGIENSLLIGKNRDGDIYTKEDCHLATSAAAQISKTQENCDLYTRLQESLLNETSAQRTTILALAKLTEYRDQETGRHLERISEYSRLIAQGLRRAQGLLRVSVEKNYLTDAYIDDLCLSSILHDIGKVGIPDHILMKPGKLSPEEFDSIKHHTLIGGRVLEDTEATNPGRSFLTIGKLVAFHHHEKWDGTGYPYGLVGENIPLSARIVAVADVYDALMSDRPYKKAFSHEQAMDIITEGRGKHFDPELVDVFLSIETEFKAIARGS